MKYLQILARSTTPSDKDWGKIPYIFISLGNIIWALSWIYVNQHNVNFAQSSIVRGIMLVPINYAMCRWFNAPTDFKDPQIFRVLVMRGTSIFIHSLLFAMSQYILPLPVVHTLNCSGTLFVFLIDYIVNQVKINKKQAIGIFIGLIGALLATNGRLLTKLIDPQYTYQTHFQNYITDDPILMTLFSFLFLIGIGFWAFGVVITKRAHSNTFQINYTLGLALIVFGAISYPFAQSKATKTQLFISIFTLSIPLVIGQWFFIGALTMTKNTGVLNMMNFIVILIAYLISIFRYGQIPNLITTLGVGFVFFGVYKTIFNKDSNQKNRQTEIQMAKNGQYQ